MKNITEIATETEQPDEGEHIAIDSSFFELPELLAYEYKSDFRDPFKTGLTRPKIKPKPPVKTTPQAPVVFPSLKLTGIIEETAMIQNSRQVVYFLIKGDTLEGARVRAITADSVVMIYKSKPFTLKF